MTNPMPVAPFSVADAARRTWPQLIEQMLDAVCLVEPEGLRIVAANAGAGKLFGRPAADLVGCPMPELAATPEDACFWREVSQGLAHELHSESFVTRRGGVAATARVDEAMAGEPGKAMAERPAEVMAEASTGVAGDVIPVVRRVSRVEPAPGTILYVVALRDRSAEVAAEHRADVQEAELQATLESVSDGILVIDRAGHISRMNRRFAQLWNVPDEMLLLRADDEVFAWMQDQVAFPIDYLRGLEALDDDAMATSTEPIELRSGASLERVATPQCCRGHPIGRVFTYRALG